MMPVGGDRSRPRALGKAGAKDGVPLKWQVGCAREGRQLWGIRSPSCYCATLLHPLLYGALSSAALPPPWPPGLKIPQNPINRDEREL